VSLPKQQRETRIVKDLPAEEIAREIRRLDGGGVTWKPYCFWRIRNPMDAGQAGARMLTAALALGAR